MAKEHARRVRGRAASREEAVAVLDEAMAFLDGGLAAIRQSGGRDDRHDAHESRQHYGVTFATLAVAAISYALLQSLVAPGAARRSRTS